MPSLWFVVPVHGRLPLAAICLRQLRRTCDALSEHSIEATAVLIGDRANLRELRRRLGFGLLGFGTIERDNQFLSRKYNDGIQLACDKRWNPRPADYVVPCGSDDWVDYRLFLELPPGGTIYGFQWASFVREDGREMTSRFIDCLGGCGIRIYPRQVVARLEYRPADEDRVRACDTSIITNLRRENSLLRVEHRAIDARQIVDWKSQGQQLNSYEALERHKRNGRADPFEALADIFPEEALHEMQKHYKRVGRQLVTA